MAGPGSIAFTGFNADGNDDLAFVALEAITSGTTIFFTDNEWDGAAFNTGESTFSWTASTAIAAGSIVTISDISTTPTSNTGTVTYVDASNVGISNSNEIIYAYIGAANAPTAFLSAIANDGLTNGGGSFDNTGLSFGSNAVDLGAVDADADIGAYTGDRTSQASLAAYRTLINTASNWTTQDATGAQNGDGTTPDTPFSAAAFVVSGPAETQQIGFSGLTQTISLSEANSGVTAYTFTIERTGGTTGDLTVTGGFSAGTTDVADFGGTLPADFSVSLLAGSASATFTVNVSGDTVVEADESFSLTISSVSNSAGIASSISAAAVTANAIIVNDDTAVPSASVTILAAAESLAGSATTPVPTGMLELVRIGSINGTGATATGRAEAVTFDAGSARAFTTNAAQNRVDIFQIGSDASLSQVGSIDINALADSGGVNSVAAKNGIVAIAYESETPGQGGHVSLFDTDGNFIKTINVGVLPDQLTFSPDGSKLLVALEGETLSAANNPVGGIAIIDMSGGAAAATLQTTIGFEALNGMEAALKAAGLNTFPGQAAAADIEPEYITVSPDGTRAYVTLQEVNAVAVVDLTDPAATAPLAILPLGSIDRSLMGNAFDGSDRDGISLENFDVASLLQPDAIASFSVGGVTYFVTANEGDARVGVSDELRLSNAAYVLDATAYPDAATLKGNSVLGRLNVISTAGDTDNDGDIDQITTFGGRSISIFRQNADGTIEKVRETGGEFEAIIAAYNPSIFNADSGSAIDDRSDNKGPEPEGVTIGEVNGRIYAFVTLERAGGVMTYDVTDPANATFVGYTPATAQDYAPEVVTFISAANSPTGEALVLSANEGSGTLTLYKVDEANVITGTEGGETLNGTSGRDRIEGGAGDDRLIGLAGNDVLVGAAGNDTLDGRSGNDNMQGGTGDDSYIVDSASDVVIELVGEGTDTVKTSLTSFTLGANVETLQFTTNADSVGSGNALANTLFGAGGNDVLKGLGGDDRLVGGAGNDVLTGGTGRDMLEGGAGADRFVFAGGDFAASLAKPDAIRDFSSADGDRIDLALAGMTSFIGTGSFTNVAGQVRSAASGGNTFVYGDVNGDGAADFAIQLTGLINLSATDFIFV